MMNRVGRCLVAFALPAGATLGTILAGALPRQDALAQGGPNVQQGQASAAQPAPGSDGPFEVAGKRFSNRSEFVTTGRRCDTPVPTEAQIRRTSAAAEAVRRVAGVEDSLNRQNRVVIPVAFHIIRRGAEGAVTRNQINHQIDVLNAAYLSSGFQFQVRDPAKDITDTDVAGTSHEAWFTMRHLSQEEREAKQELSKNHDPHHFLNIYTANLGDGLLGWATFPSDLDFNQFVDGVVVLHTSLPADNGAPNPGGGPFGLGHTSTHEIGHWLGLFHTFQGGCVPPGDEVVDTPAHQVNFGCPSEATDTCAGGAADPVHNFMNYTDDACMNVFTDGQLVRMREQTTAFRGDLYALPSDLLSRIQGAARAAGR